MALSMEITSVWVQFFDDAEKIVETERMLKPDQCIDEIIKDVIAYTPVYEINGDVETELPDGMPSTIPIRAVCRRGKKVYRSGIVWSLEDILNLPSGSKRDSMISICNTHKCRHVILVTGPDTRERAFPFFADRDAREISLLDGLYNK